MNYNHNLQSFRTLLNKGLVIIALLLFGFTLQAQTNRQVSGTLKNKAGAVVSGASIKLISEKDSIYTSSDNVGFYNFRNLQGVNFKMTIHSLGYDTLYHEFQFEAARTQMLVAPLTMEESSQYLDEVSVVARVDIVVKEDTLEYNTKDLKLREGALVEDALKKLDGVEVDKDGNVTAQGESVTRIRINGKDFFGGDVKAATRNLPADIIEKIQIVDDYGDMANITGNRTGDPERILNIQIDPSRNTGSLGNFKVGGGSEERYQVTGMLGYMKEGMQLMGLGNMNNVNASLFDFNIRGGGARRSGGGGGSFGRGFGGGGMGGGSNGLTNTNSIGLNYRQDFNPAFTMYGNYSFSHDDNKTTTFNINDYFNEQLMEVRDNQTGSQSTSHRFDWNFEYKPTDKDYFKLSPTLSVRGSDSDGLLLSDNTLSGTLINSLNKTNSSKNFAPNYGISGLYNRRLSQSGRNLFFDFSLNTSSTEQDEEIIQQTAIMNGETDAEAYIRTLADLNNKSLNGGASVSYTEPLSDKSSLEFNYDYNFRNYDNRRFDNALDAAGQQIIDDEIFIGNRIFDYSFVTHRVGANYRFRSDKIIYSIGASVQPNRLSGDATVQDQVMHIDRTGFNFAPIARFEYKFSRTKSFSVRYSGRSTEPSFSQLQPFTDYSNRNNLVTGNPNLDAEFGHELRVSFNNFNVGSGQSWFAAVTGSVTEDKIVSNRTIVVDPELGVVQSTGYLNTDGFYNLRAFYNYSIPFKNRTYVLSFNGNSGYNNNISYTDNVKGVGKNLQLSQGLNFRYNPKETIEITPGVRYSYNNTTNSATSSNRGSVSNVINSWSYSLNTAINITPTLVWGGDLSKTTNSGYSNVVGANPFIINTYIEKQFLKGRNGAIRFQAFDLLNEQTNVSRSVTENLINDSRSNRLGQYFMLTLSYRFQSFAGGNMGFSGQGGGHGGMGGGQGMNRGGMGGF